MDNLVGWQKANCLISLGVIGGPCWIRTSDQLVKSQRLKLLYLYVYIELLEIEFPTLSAVSL